MPLNHNLPSDQNHKYVSIRLPHGFPGTSCGPRRFERIEQHLTNISLRLPSSSRTTLTTTNTSALSAVHPPCQIAKHMMLKSKGFGSSPEALDWRRSKTRSSPPMFALSSCLCKRAFTLSVRNLVLLSRSQRTLYAQCQTIWCFAASMNLPIPMNS